VKGFDDAVRRSPGDVRGARTRGSADGPQLLARKLWKQADPLAARLMNQAKMDATFFTRRTGPGLDANGAEQAAAVQQAAANALRKLADDAFTHQSAGVTSQGKIVREHLGGNNDLPALLKNRFVEHMRRELTNSQELRRSPGEVISNPGVFQNETVDLLADQLSKQLQRWQQTALEYLMRYTPLP